MSGGDVLAVTLNLDGVNVDAAESACFALGAYTVTYTDARDDAILEPVPGEFRLWPASRLQAIFSAAADGELLRVVLAAKLQIALDRLQIEVLRDRDWEREWLKDFHAMRFGQRLWVCPSHAQVADPDAVVVMLDPGLAFGTGTHPTTRLCLEWLDAHPPRDSMIIDYGCGSGILALAALRLGASHAACHDIDPQALIATRDNAALNGLAPRLTLVAVAADLRLQSDLLLANILSGPLCELAPALAGKVRVGGTIVLSGLLAAQAAEVRAAYACWFEMQQATQRDDWVCLAGTRRAVASRPNVGQN